MFKSKNFCHVASNNRNQVKVGVFVYRTTDDLDTVTASGYFNERIIDINLHDLIIHEKVDPTDATNVERNLLSVSERTLDNVGTVVVQSKWEGDIEQAIEDIYTYVDNTFVKKDGSSIMTGPLKFRAGSFEGAIAGGLGDGISIYKMNPDGSINSEVASLTKTNGFVPGTNNAMDIGSGALKWKDAYIGRVITSVLNNGYDIAVPVTNSADTLALKSQVDLAANSGSQLYATGVWYAKMYAASTVPTGAEYDGRNYADFSQVDSDNNPIIVIYEGQSGAWVEIDRITPPATYNGYITVTSKIWDIVEQYEQQGGLVLWSYNQKTFTPYPRIISYAGFANTDLDNLTSVGQNIGNWSSNVTNCITEIPQDIKLELNNGTLTLKAGSKVYVPNGDGVFDEVVIANDLSYTGSLGTNEQMCVSVYGDGSIIALTPVNRCTSGTTAPTQTNYRWWYDTSTNLVKEYSGGSYTGNKLSFPIAIVTALGDGTSTISSIDQVFNGFGYIGSTIFALPGIKALVPDGRNEDGTLKNIEITVSSVQTTMPPSLMVGQNNALLMLKPNGGIYGEVITCWGSIKYLKNLAEVSGLGAGGKSCWYCAEDNKIHLFDSYNVESIISQVFVGNYNTDYSSPRPKITLLNTKQSLHVLDYNDTEYMAHQAMPSNKYLNLTLGASWDVYYAPADGYVVIRKTSTAANQFVKIVNRTSEIAAATTSPFSGYDACATIPVSKGDRFQVAYTTDGTTNYFRFVYANGAK